MKLLLLVASALLLQGCFSSATDVDNSAERISTEALVIGVMGRYRDNQDPFARGVKMAADEVNAQGGIGGRNIELVYRKSDCNATTARFEAENILVQYPDLIAVAGPECSGAGQAINDVIGAQNIPIVAFTTSSPSLSLIDSFFRLQASDLAIIDGFVLSVMQESDLNNDGVVNLGIIYGDDLFNAGLGQGIVDSVTLKGGVVDAQVIYPDGILVDFDQYIEQIFIDENGGLRQFDVLAIMGFEREIANITQQIHQFAATHPQLNLAGIPIYTSGLDAVVLEDGAPDIVENLVTLTPDGAFSPIVFPNLPDFIQAFNNKWGANETEEDAAQGYDAMMLIALALMQAQESGLVDAASATSVSIRQGILDNLRDVSRGVFDFEAQGDQADTVYVNPGQYAKAVEGVKAGKDINYNGASGFIDFDEFGDVNYGAFFLQRTQREGDSFTLINESLKCFGPPACSE